MQLPIVGDIRCGKADIDRCISPIIKALNEGGVLTKGSCCGHGKVMGYIHLDNGKYLGVFPNRKAMLQFRNIEFWALENNKSSIINEESSLSSGQFNPEDETQRSGLERSRDSAVEPPSSGLDQF